MVMLWLCVTMFVYLLCVIPLPVLSCVPLTLTLFLVSFCHGQYTFLNYVLTHLLYEATCMSVCLFECCICNVYVFSVL